MGLPDRRTEGVSGKLPSLTPCRGLGASRGPRGHSRNSAGSRETVHSVREFRHAVPPWHQQEKSLSVVYACGGVGNMCHHPGDTKPIAAPGPGNR